MVLYHKRSIHEREVEHTSCLAPALEMRRPTTSSARGLVFVALAEGHTTRETILAHVLDQAAEPQPSRKQLLKVLSKECLDGRVTGIDESRLTKLRKEADERRQCERKRPRELAHLADYFENGVKGIP